VEVALWHIIAVAALDRLAPRLLPPPCNFAERRWPVDLETMLISLYVLVDDWWGRAHPPSPRKPGRPLSSRSRIAVNFHLSGEVCIGEVYISFRGSHSKRSSPPPPRRFSF
jgi:hypothetical protein